MIWKNAVADAEPRLVELFTKSSEEEQHRDLKVRHRPPVLLQVNQEARYVALKTYRKFLDNEACFLDPKKDVVVMRDWSIPIIYRMWIEHRVLQDKIYRPQVEEQVRHLVVCGKERYPSLAGLESCGFRNIRKIILQKSKEGLTSRQQTYLSRGSWTHFPNPGNKWHFTHFDCHDRLELSFLTGGQMDKKVRQIP